jgi:hypothetical protein
MTTDFIRNGPIMGKWRGFGKWKVESGNGK